MVPKEWRAETVHSCPLQPQNHLGARRLYFSLTVCKKTSERQTAQNPSDSGVTVQHRPSSHYIQGDRNCLVTHSTADTPVCYCFLEQMHSVPVCFWFKAWNKQKGNNYLIKLLYYIPFQDFSFPQEASVHSFFSPSHFFQSHFFLSAVS